MKLIVLFTIVINFLGGCQKGELVMNDYNIKVVHVRNMYYKIDIFQKNKIEKVQTIELRNGEDCVKEDNSKIQYIDNIPYLVVFGGKTEKGEWYKLWKFDSDSNQFIWFKTTDPGDKIL